MSTTKHIRDSGIVEDFVPPPGPPPPIMPEGWIARFDDRYQQFFYVNLLTKQSQWEKPPGTIDAPISGRASCEGDRPSSYGDVKSTSPRPGSSYGQRDEFATQQTTYPIASSQPQHPQYQTQTQSQYFNTPQQAAEPKSPGRGIAGRVSSFLKSHSSKPTPNYPPQQGQQYYQYYSAQQGYGPQQGYYQQQSRPAYAQSGGPGYMQGPPQRSGVGGMGVGGAAALGVGGGLLGGALLANSFDDHDDYQQGFEDGADFGGDYGGGDF